MLDVSIIVMFVVLFHNFFWVFFCCSNILNIIFTFYFFLPLRADVVDIVNISIAMFMLTLSSPRLPCYESIYVCHF